MGVGARGVVETAGYLYMSAGQSHELLNLKLLNASSSHDVWVSAARPTTSGHGEVGRRPGEAEGAQAEEGH